MRFLADMGVSSGVVEWLRNHGHDAKHLRDDAERGQVSTFDSAAKPPGFEIEKI